MQTDLSQVLARNIKYYRKLRGLSQSKLGEESGVPRTTITHLESGEGNPQLSTLVALSQCFNIQLDELLAEPYNPVHLVKKEELKKLKQAKGQVEIFKLLPEPLHGFEIDRVFIEKGFRMKGAPHAKGFKEYLCCIRGEVRLHTEGDAYDLKAGDVLIFPGDQAHSYLNTGSATLEFISVIHRQL